MYAHTSSLSQAKEYSQGIRGVSFHRQGTRRVNVRGSHLDCESCVMSEMVAVTPL